MAREYKPPDEAFEGIREHLEYEVAMLVETAAALQDFSTDEMDSSRQWCTHNALLESFLIHARVLIDFLYPPASHKKGDVFAEHFLGDPGEWRKTRSKLPSGLERVRKRANKEVAHLTYARVSVTPEDKTWPFVEIAQEITADLEEFISLASPDKVGDPLRKAISSEIESLGKMAVIRPTATTTGPVEGVLIPGRGQQ